jgi:hypothetical protein
MGILTTAADTVYTFRFLKILVTPWNEMPAFKVGVIDKDGAPQLKIKDMTSEQRDVYTMFHRLVFKFKRLMAKVPGGKSRIGSYVAALWLIKEETGLDDHALHSILEDYIDISASDINENFVVGMHNELLPGVYKLTNSILSPTTGETIANPGDKVIAHGNEILEGCVFNYNIYSVQHQATKQMIFVSSGDITR